MLIIFLTKGAFAFKPSNHACSQTRSPKKQSFMPYLLQQYFFLPELLQNILLTDCHKQKRTEGPLFYPSVKFSHP